MSTEQRLAALTGGFDGGTSEDGRRCIEGSRMTSDWQMLPSHRRALLWTGRSVARLSGTFPAACSHFLKHRSVHRLQGRVLRFDLACLVPFPIACKTKSSRSCLRG